MSINDKLTLSQLEEWLSNKELGGIVRIIGEQLADVMRDNERFRETLRFYADYHKNYKPEEFEMNSAIVNDGGKKAREALSNKDTNRE